MSVLEAAQIQKLHFTQDLVNKSAEFSKSLYDRTGLHSEFLEQQAQKISQVSSSLAQLVDSTVSKVDASRKNLSERTSQKRKDLISKAMNLAVVKKADNLGNFILTELEQQVFQLSLSISKKIGEQDKRLGGFKSIGEQSMSVEQGQFSSESESCRDYELDCREPREEGVRNSERMMQRKIDCSKVSLRRRTSRLVSTLNDLGRQIVESYFRQLSSLRVVQSAQEKYIMVDKSAREAFICMEAFVEVLAGTVLTQHIVNPLLNQLQVKYAHSKGKVTVIVENIRHSDVQSVLESAKHSYSSLKDASVVALKNGKLSLTFAQSVFKSQVNKIQDDISQLLKDVSTYRQKLSEQTLALYQLSIQEFKNKKNAKLALKLHPQSSAPSLENNQR